MTTVPTWAAYVVSIGTPALTFVGVLIAQRMTRVGAKELETRSKREETMRNLRWASELAVDNDPNKARLGVAQLAALGRSDMLDAEQQLFIDAALDTVLKEPVEEIEGAGEGAQVVLAAARRHIELRGTAASVVPSTEESTTGREG